MFDESLSHRRTRGLNTSDNDSAFLPTPATSGKLDSSVHNLFISSPKSASGWSPIARTDSLGQVGLTPVSTDDTFYRIRLLLGRAIGILLLLLLAYFCLWRLPKSVVTRIFQTESDALQLEPPIGLRVRHTSATTLQVGCFCLSRANIIAQQDEKHREDIFIHRYHSAITLGPAFDTDGANNERNRLECPTSASFIWDSANPKQSPSLCFLVYAKGRVLPERLGWEVVRHSLRHPKADHTKWRMMPLEPTLWNAPESGLFDMVFSALGLQNASNEDGNDRPAPEVWVDF